MNELKVGDRVRVVLANGSIKTKRGKILNGATGTVKDTRDERAGIEFDDYIGGHDGLWNGKPGYCWYIPYERLEKIEETYTSLFPPKYGEDYFYLNVEHDEDENTNFYVLKYKWKDDVTDYGMLALGNVFGSKEEALKNKDKLLEKMERLREGEQI